MKHSQIVSRCSVPNYCGSAAFDGVTRAHHPPSPKSARNARIRKVSFVTWSGLSESLLISDRNACFKRCLTSATPCFLREILLFQWLKCLLCCWIRAYARIRAAMMVVARLHTVNRPQARGVKARAPGSGAPRRRHRSECAPATPRAAPPRREPGPRRAVG